MLGTSGERDLVTHAEGLEIAFVELHELVESTFEQRRRAGSRATRPASPAAISRTAVIRYDAYDEMSGRQSSSMALLDEQGTGVVLSSILHRDQARLYVKGVRDGHRSSSSRRRRTRRSGRRSIGSPSPSPGRLLLRQPRQAASG